MEFPITDGGVTAPLTLCSAKPTFVRFRGFLALKVWCFAFAMQNCHLCSHFIIKVLICMPSHTRISSQWTILPHQLFAKSSTYATTYKPHTYIQPTNLPPTTYTYHLQPTSTTCNLHLPPTTYTYHLQTYRLQPTDNPVQVWHHPHQYQRKYFRLLVHHGRISDKNCSF